MADVKKKTIVDFRKMKAEGDKITWLTGYDYLTAKYEERAGVEMILVGDSAGNVMHGYKDTWPVTMDEMISHAKAVRKGAPNTFCVGDMPFMSYQISNEEAIINAGRFIKEADMDAIKLEGYTKSCLRESLPSTTPAWSLSATSASPRSLRLSWAATRLRASLWKLPLSSSRLPRTSKPQVLP